MKKFQFIHLKKVTIFKNYINIKKGIQQYDKYVSDREADIIVKNCLNSKKNAVSLKTFMYWYGREMLKPKSNRSSVESLNVMEWPESLKIRPSKEELMRMLREKEETHKKHYTINQTRSSILRMHKIRDEIERSNRRYLNTMMGIIKPRPPNPPSGPISARARPVSGFRRSFIGPQFLK